MKPENLKEKRSGERRSFDYGVTIPDKRKKDRRKKMKTKKDRTYSFNHFKERLKERYGLDIDENEYEQFCNVIISGKKFHINTEIQKKDIQEIYDVPMGGMLIRVVWSRGKQLLTTVLPIRQHHIWCNYPHTNPDTCKMCERFYRDYPMNDLTPDELLKKHFPDAIKRGE